MEYKDLAKIIANKIALSYDPVRGFLHSYLYIAEEILSLDGIEIKSDDQTQPEFLALGNISKLDLVNETRKSMIEPDAEGKHFVRVIPKPRK